MKVFKRSTVLMILSVVFLLVAGVCIFTTRDEKAAVSRGAYVRIEPDFAREGELRPIFYAPEVVGMQVDRKAGTVKFEIEGGFEVQATLGESIWSESCQTMVNAIKIEALRLKTMPLQLGRLKIAEPALVSTCGPGQEWVVALMDLQASCPWWEASQSCAPGCAWWEESQVCLWFGQERIKLRVEILDSATNDVISGAVLVLQRGSDQQSYAAPAQIGLVYREVVRLEAQAPGYVGRSLELATAEKYFEVFSPEGNPLTWTNWRDGKNRLTIELVKLP